MLPDLKQLKEKTTDSIVSQQMTTPRIPSNFGRIRTLEDYSRPFQDADESVESIDIPIDEGSTDGDLPKDYMPASDLRIATMTLVARLNSNINTARLREILPSSLTMEGSDWSRTRILLYEKKKKAERKNSKNKKSFYNQTTVLVKPFLEREKPVNMKVSKNGSLQMTGVRSVEEGRQTVQQMIRAIADLDDRVFYRDVDAGSGAVIIDTASTDTMTTATTQTEDTTVSREEARYFLNREEILAIGIRSIKCELIIVSFKLPFYVHLERLNTILQTKYNLLSIWQTSSYPGVNTKITYSKDCDATEHIKKKRYLCRCRDMSIFTFRTGKVIITGYESLAKIQEVYQQYIDIVRAERAHIQLESLAETAASRAVSKQRSTATTKTKRRTIGEPSRIMTVGSKTFMVVEDF